MKKKDIMELKKRLKKDHCTFTKLSGCFVNSKKDVILKMKESFLNLEEDDYFKYLEIAKKVLSGTIRNNILELSFPNNGVQPNEKQLFLTKLKKSKLMDDELIDEFYKSIIDSYDYTGNYLILLFHDVYDIITKTSDNLKMDESEEIFEYVLCAISPVSLSAPGLSYYEDENKIKSRMRDWIVEAPTVGFMYPAFIDRSADVNSIMYYTKNAVDPHPELMENALGCISKETSAIQKGKFQSIIKGSVSADEDEAEKIYSDIQDNLYSIVEEHNAIVDNEEEEPIKLEKSDLQNVLEESGVTKENAIMIEKFYEKSFNDDIPLVEALIDGKVIKANEFRKKEKALEKQVEFLKDKLEQVGNQNNIDGEYDIVVNVKPDKAQQIRTETIDGQECIVIPVNENEKITINELR